MRILPLILIGLFFQTCNNPEKKSQAPIKTTNPTFALPKEVNSYIQKKQVGWTLADTSDYSKVWWSLYEKDQIPYYVTTDINDDEISDYAIILKKNNTVKLHILISSGKTYASWVDNEFNPSYSGRGAIIEHGLSLVSPNHFDFVAKGEEKQLSLVSNAIVLSELENMTKIYYWAEGKLQVMNVKS